MTTAHVAEDSSLAGLERCQRHGVTITGTTGPWIMLQHGFGTDQQCWHKVLPSLSPHFRVVMMDLAGAGANGAEIFDAGRYDQIETHADDVLAVLHELEISEITYIGASVGCMVGMLAAITQPSLFRRLIFIAASPRYLNDSDYTGGFDQEHLDALYEAMHRDYQGWISGFAPLAVRGVPESEAVQEFSASLFTYRPDIALSMARTIFQSDFRRHLALIQTPTVLLHTTNDIAVPHEVGEFLQQRIRDSKLETLPVEGHFPHLVAPHVVSEALLRHL